MVATKKKVGARRRKRHISSMTGKSSITGKLVVAIPSIAGAASLVLLGFMTTAVWEQASELGGMKEVLSRQGERLDAIDATLKSIDKTLEGVGARIAHMDADPARYLVAAGVTADNMFGVVRVGTSGGLWIFPRNEKARAQIEASGLVMAPVAPGMFGYKAPEAMFSSFTFKDGAPLTLPAPAQ